MRWPAATYTTLRDTIQGWSAEDVTDEDAETYETVQCTACAQLHFVNPRTGKVLSKRDE
jgi:hypothetical protein